MLQTKVKLKRTHLLIGLLLIAATLAVYWPMWNQDFINLDDDLHVTENRYVQGGLTREGAIWAFTNVSQAGFWHPLTWLSLMVDHDLYGLKAGGYKFTNLLFHLTNTILLYLLLIMMTGKMWRSAFVAALFALHPLHVESVAWVTERKDVLSTMFWLLCLWAYLGYVEHPGWKKYSLILLTFTLGLMAKPMLVTLPFTLLLLDYWPLNRFHPPIGEAAAEAASPRPLGNPARAISPALNLILEKLPLIFLSLAASAVAFLAESSRDNLARTGAVSSLDLLPIKLRLANILVSYVSYLGKTLWPQSLGVFYPHPGNSLPIWQIIGAGLLLLLISSGVLRYAKRNPYLLVGWLWYLGTLLPVIGLVQIGGQAMADHFTYVPLIGLFIMIAWGIPDLLAGWRQRRLALALGASAIISAAIVLSCAQVQLWENSRTLYEHTLKVTKNNLFIQNNLGVTLVENGRVAEAVSHYHEALKIAPNDPLVHNNLGMALALLGNTQDAIIHYSEALRIKPDYAEAHNNLGIVLAQQGRLQEAAAQFSAAVQLEPSNSAASDNLKASLELLGKH